MLENLLLDITSLIPTGAGDPGVSSTSLPVSYICSGAGAYILGKFTGGLGAITLSINYSALLVGAFLANWLFMGISLPIDHNLEQPLLITIVGMAIGAMTLMWLHRGELDNA